MSGRSWKRVLEQLEAAGDRREVEPVCLVLPLEPAGPDSADGPTAGEDVEGGGDLGQVRDVAVGDACDHGAQRHPPGEAGEEPERGPAVEQGVPVPADLGDLDEVVHHPEAGEAHLLCGSGHRSQTAGDLGRAAGPVERGDLQAEGHAHGSLLLPAGGVGRRHELGMDDTHGP